MCRHCTCAGCMPCQHTQPLSSPSWADVGIVTLLLSCTAHHHEEVFVSEGLSCRRGSSEGLQQTPHDPGGIALPWVHPACRNIPFPTLIGRPVAQPVMCVHTPLFTIQITQIAQAHDEHVQGAVCYPNNTSMSRATNVHHGEVLSAFPTPFR